MVDGADNTELEGADPLPQAGRTECTTGGDKSGCKEAEEM